MPKITEVDLPLSLPEGRVVGKARVIEGEGEDAVLIEMESSNPIVASLIKEGLVGVSFFYIPQMRPIEIDFNDSRTIREIRPGERHG